MTSLRTPTGTILLFPHPPTPHRNMISLWGLTLMTSSNPNYLPKAPPPNTIALGVRTLALELGCVWGGGEGGEDTQMFSPQQQLTAVMKSVALLFLLTSVGAEARAMPPAASPRALRGPSLAALSQRDEDPCVPSERSVLTPGTHLPASDLTLVGNASLSLLETHGQRE